VPRIHDPRHIPELFRLVETESIHAIIPLIDSDLLALSQVADQLAELNCAVIISSEEVIRNCADKLLTYQLLRSAGIDTPRTWTTAEILSQPQHVFPYFMKPREGSAGQGLYRVNDEDELRVFAKRCPDSIVQEFVDGIEHTLDVYTGLDGVPRCVVPRRRLEVRTGEVSKGLIVKDPAIMAVGRHVVKVLGACRGVVTVQCIVTPDGRIRVIEINPRVGGGAPLAIAAGADFPKWLMMELLGRELPADCDNYQDNIAMYRYDESIFVDGNLGQSIEAGHHEGGQAQKTFYKS
jgi:carbamoyl-phosphate synthase large subunit